MRAQHKRAVEISGARGWAWAAFLQQSMPAIPGMLHSFSLECRGMPAKTLPPITRTNANDAKRFLMPLPIYGSRPTLSRMLHSNRNVSGDERRIIFARLASIYSIFRERIIGITIQPTLSGFCGGDNWMSARVCMLCSMAIWRVVTAQRHAASLTDSQMDPLGGNLHALFTLPPLSMFDARNRLYVGTSLFSHHLLLYWVSNCWC